MEYEEFICPNCGHVYLEYRGRKPKLSGSAEQRHKRMLWREAKRRQEFREKEFREWLKKKVVEDPYETLKDNWV